MFKLVAMLFLVVNGSPAEKPSGMLTYNKSTFPTLEACMAFGATEDGKAAVQAINEITQAKQMMAKVGCMKAEDNTI